MEYILLTAVSFLTTFAKGDLCCMPNQFEGHESAFVGFVNRGKAFNRTEETSFSYDAINRKVYTYVRVIDSEGGYDVATIQDFKQKVQYSLTENLCTKTVLSETKWQKLCVPDDAKFVLNTTMGLGLSIFNTTLYELNVDSTPLYVTVTNNCIPMFAFVSGRPNEYYEYLKSIKYHSFTEGIRNPSIFTPPDYCNNVSISLIPAKTEIRPFLLR